MQSNNFKPESKLGEHDGSGWRIGRTITPKWNDSCMELSFFNETDFMGNVIKDQLHEVMDFKDKTIVEVLIKLGWTPPHDWDEKVKRGLEHCGLEKPFPVVSFALNEKQQVELDDWRSKIKALHGRVGVEEFCFTSTGIGVAIKVKNKTFNIEIDISHEEEW